MRSVYVETTIDSEMKIYASPKNKGKLLQNDKLLGERNILKISKSSDVKKIENYFPINTLYRVGGYGKLYS